MKYWVYMDGEVPGCYTPADLVALNGFSMTTLVCPAEGEILEKNWRRSGEFPDIIKVLHERDAQRPPSAPAMAQEAVMTTDVDQLIDTASSRLFNHVADLMKELENRREEQALTLSLQRQIVEVKQQLQEAREKNASLESKVPRIKELEDLLRKEEQRALALEASLKAREEGLSELRLQLEKSRTEHEASRRRLGETLNDLAIRNRLVDKLSRDLTEKELSLAKSLGLIRRLEEDLHRLVPSSRGTAAQPDAQQTAQEKPIVDASVHELPSTPIKTRPSDGPDDIPPSAPQAQHAIVNVFKRFITKDIQS